MMQQVLIAVSVVALLAAFICIVGQKERERDLGFVVLYVVIVALGVCTLFSGCIPKPQPPEFHVAAISINGVETKTSFLLTTMENENGKNGSRN